ncbi:MAG: non-canonical purine NTP pyrophosphatase [Candidatus Heimdallarchaeota archaeon]
MTERKTITFATNNKEKIADIEAMIGENFNLVFTSNLELIEVQTLSVEEVVAFKAKQAFELLQTPVAVSDSGLEIRALKNFPGALVKFANESLGQERIVKLLAEEDDRTAFFVAAIGFCDKDSNVKVFVERDEGTIASEPRGEGWHFDKIFIPKGDTRTWSEFGRERKNKHSAFKRALEKMAHYLEKKE